MSYSACWPTMQRPVKFWLGDNGALAVADPAAVLIESSTVSPGWIAELVGARRSAGIGFLDAPVTGSRGRPRGAAFVPRGRLRRDAGIGNARAPGDEQGDYPPWPYRKRRQAEAG